MTIYMQRQICALLADGQKDDVPDATVFPYRVFDVLPKISLILEDGQFTQNYISVAASESYTIPLPENYDSSTERLAVTIRTTARTKVVVVGPSETSTYLLKATSGTTEGDHKGILMFQEKVTSITVSVPATFDTALIDYFIWVIPDLAVPESYRIGNRAFGYIVGESGQ